MIKGLLVIFLLSFLFAGCAPKHPVMGPREEPAPGPFFSSQKTPVNEVDLVTALKDKDFILIGESHNNACDHQIQARIIELMAMEGQEFVVGLEMVSVERQEILDRFNKGLIDTDQLPEKLGWKEKWGYDFELYRPIFDTVRKHSVNLSALNLPSQVVRSISHYGLDYLSPEDRTYLPEKLIYPPPDQLEMLKDQFYFHEDLIQADQAMFERFVAAQSAWDTSMAHEAVKARQVQQKQVIILAGTLHVDKGQGIEHRLRVLRPESRIAGIVPVRSIEEISPDNAFSYFCPPASSRMRLGIVAEMENTKVMVTGVVQGSLAMESGLEKGDQIVRANEKEVSSLADLHAAAVEALEDDHEFRLEVLRNGRLEVFEISF